MSSGTFGWTPVFSTIIDSSVWRESKETRLVWITILAKKDRMGYVRSALWALARDAGVTEQECEEAVRILEAPDPESRSKVEEGRRIRKVDGGWQVINHFAYRDLISKTRHREHQAQWQREYRKRQKGGDGERMEPPEDQPADAPKDPPKGFTAPTLEEVKLHGAKSGMPESEMEAFWNYYQSNGWKVGKNRMKSWHSAMAGWKIRWEEKRGKTAERFGPALGECQEYAREHGFDDLGFVTWWHQAMVKKQWKNGKGNLIDWKIELAGAMSNRRTKQSEGQVTPGIILDPKP